MVSAMDHQKMCVLPQSCQKFKHWILCLTKHLQWRLQKSLIATKQLTQNDNLLA